MLFNFSLKDSLIPVSSALIVGSLSFSLINLLNEFNRIKIKYSGGKAIKTYLVFFFFFAAISSLVPYISGAPCGVLGYPIFWNALSVFSFILFLRVSRKLAINNYLYKTKDGGKYLKFIQDCTRKTQTLSSCLSSVEQSIENIVKDAQRNPPKEDAKLFEKPDVPEKNKPAWNAIGLLSAQNVVEFIVENDYSVVESILKAYENKGTPLTNTILLHQLVNRLLFNENSMMRKMGRTHEKMNFASLFSEDLVRKYGSSSTCVGGFATLFC